MFGLDILMAGAIILHNTDFCKSSEVGIVTKYGKICLTVEQYRRLNRK
jgi:hypothetical protein